MADNNEDQDNKMAPSTVIWIGIGSGLGLILIVTVCCLSWWCWRKRRQLRKANEATVMNTFKIHTLGNHYKISSETTVNGDISPNRKFSMASDRKLSGVSQQFSHASGHTSNECEMLLTVEERNEPGSSQEDNATSYSQTPRGSGGGHWLEVPGRGRSDSTYLDFPGGERIDSRKPSATSQFLSMQEIERNSLGIIQHAREHQSMNEAPLARAESSQSLETSSSVEAIQASQPPPLPTKTRTGVQDVSIRPNSAAPAGYSQKFVPKLPPKKKRFAHCKSSSDITDGNDDQSHGGEHHHQGISKSFRSEADIYSRMSDYDDLPDEENRLPKLPPKKLPRLPPKQKINKSKEDLVQIENHFKSSLQQLKSLEQDLDYDDLPPESNTSRRVSAASHVLNGHGEFEDYDDPPPLPEIPKDPHPEDYIPDYDDPVARETESRIS